MDGEIFITPPLDYATFIRTILVCGGAMMFTLHVVERASQIRGGYQMLAMAALLGGGYWLDTQGLFDW